jgi:hypothetical protein
MRASWGSLTFTSFHWQRRHVNCRHGKNVKFESVSPLFLSSYCLLQLKECGVFGVSSAEYLNYALANRREWEMRGKVLVKDLIDKHSRPTSGHEKEG